MGNASNDGMGKASVNLLTNQYIGEWNFYDLEKEELKLLPIIKTKMMLPKTTLNTFNDAIIGSFLNKSSALYSKYK